MGGTFTDLWVLTSDGRSTAVKAPTTPDVVSGVLDAVGLASAELGMSVENFCRAATRFGHGTTVGLNALLTGRTAVTGVLTTAGFADTLEIGRLTRSVAGLSESGLGDYLRRGGIPPLVARRLVAEVAERVDRTGKVVLPLDEASAHAAIERLAEAEVEAVAVATLWATENPVHELRLRDLVAEQLPDVYVSLSHEVSPAVGEYARMSTTAANAALGPIAARYLHELDVRLKALGLTVPILMTTCAGGVVPATALAARPVTALLSGPAAGVTGGWTVARRAVGHPAATISSEDVLTLDVGGTSFDVGMVIDGAPLMRSLLSFGGADIRVPTLDVGSIGAGGGSIASVRDGALAVGPESAAATPGPACYGRGGSRPTATDADLLLGILDPDAFLGGRLRLDRAAAEDAVRRHVAEPLGLDVRAAAWGIREVFDASMADLLRRVTVERGHDPREFTVVAGGGSGPSHAWALCRELGMESFLVPSSGTVQSAYGAGTSDLRVSAERTVYLRFPPGAAPGEEHAAEAAAAIADTIVRARADLPPALADEQVTVATTLSLRYRGQAHALDVPIDQTERSRLSAGLLAKALISFEQAYEALFGRGAAFRAAGFEVLGVRTLITGRLPGAAIMPTGEPMQPATSRSVVFDDPSTPIDTPVYRTTQPVGDQYLAGPALVEYPGQVVVVPPGWSATTDADGTLHVAVGS